MRGRSWVPERAQERPRRPTVGVDANDTAEPGALITYVEHESTAETSARHDEPTPHPIGVAPLAMAPPEPVAAKPRRRRASWRMRVINAAVASSTLAALPLAGATARPDPSDDVDRIAGATDALRDADGRTELERALIGLRAGHRLGEVQAAATGQVRPAPAPAPVPAPDEPTPIAHAAGLDLVVPSMETVLVGFHEAAAAGTEEMTPLAPISADHTHKEVKKAKAERIEEQQVAPVTVLPTRDRAQPPTSAIDIAIPEGEQVVAPVSGEVVMASPYTLYGKYADTRVEIIPDGHPDLRVIMIHVDDVEVGVGDRVEAGETVVAGTSTAFPFESQIDRFSAELSGSAHPHVHIEVKRVG